MFLQTERRKKNKPTAVRTIVEITNKHKREFLLFFPLLLSIMRESVSWEKEEEGGEEGETGTAAASALPRRRRRISEILLPSFSLWYYSAPPPG